MIQTGTIQNDYINDAGVWYLHLAQPPGDRYFLQHIDFQKPFTERQPPIVLVMLNGLDSDDRNERVHVTAEDITNNGFVLRYATWGDTRLYAASVTWIAIPRSMALYVPDSAAEDRWPVYYYYSYFPRQEVRSTPYGY
jgi:hypothetical protein